MSDRILSEIKRLMAAAGVPELGPGPRDGVQPQKLLEESLEQLWADSKLASERRDLVLALVLLWHDHLDASHLIAQAVENRDGSFVHGIMHRREADYGNAKYWFHRVGVHVAFPAISARAIMCLEAKGENRWRDRLLPKGMWDPFAFVDACQADARTPNSGSDQELLRDLQRIEMESLLEHLLRP